MGSCKNRNGSVELNKQILCKDYLTRVRTITLKPRRENIGVVEITGLVCVAPSYAEELGWWTRNAGIGDLTALRYSTVCGGTVLQVSSRSESWEGRHIMLGLEDSQVWGSQMSGSIHRSGLIYLLLHLCL